MNSLALLAENETSVIRMIQADQERFHTALAPVLRQAAEFARHIEESTALMSRLAESLKPTIEIMQRMQASTLEAMTPREMYITRPVTYSPRTITMRLHQDDLEFLADKLGERIQPLKRANTRASYILPEGAQLRKVRMKFVDGHTVKVQYPGMALMIFDYKDLGFVNRKTNNPDTKWEFLRTMAENGGSLTASKFDRRFGRNTKYEVSERLKTFFGVEDRELFYPYSKADGYRTHITLLTEQDRMSIEDESSFY